MSFSPSSATAAESSVNDAPDSLASLIRPNHKRRKEKRHRQSLGTVEARNEEARLTERETHGPRGTPPVVDERYLRYKNWMVWEWGGSGQITKYLPHRRRAPPLVPVGAEIESSTWC